MQCQEKGRSAKSVAFLRRLPKGKLVLTFGGFDTRSMAWSTARRWDASATQPICTAFGVRMPCEALSYPRR